MPHPRRYSSSDRDSRCSYQDRYRDRGRRHRHRRSPSYSSSSDRDRDRRGRGHRQDGSFARTRSRSYDNRSTEHRPFDRRYCEGYRRLDQSRDRDRDRDREPHGATESYYSRDFSPNMYDYRRGRERERERDESYRRKGSRRKHKRRRRRTRSYSPSSSVSTARPEILFYLPLSLFISVSFTPLSLCLCLSLTISSPQLLELVSRTIFMISFFCLFVLLAGFWLTFLLKWVLLQLAFLFGRAFSFFAQRFLFSVVQERSTCNSYRFFSSVKTLLTFASNSQTLPVQT